MLQNFYEDVLVQAAKNLDAAYELWWSKMKHEDSDTAKDVVSCDCCTWALEGACPKPTVFVA